MTISSTTNRVAYTGNGATTAFAVSFPFHAQADLVVLSTVISTGVQTTKTLTTDYTISGSTDALGHYSSGGTVTFIAAPASTERITIYRDPARTQGLDLQDASSFPAENVEAQLDYITMLLQRVSDLINRTTRQPDGDAANIGTMPSLVERISSYAGYDSNGEPVALSAPTDTSITTTFTRTLLDDTTAAAFRTTLGANAMPDNEFTITGSADTTKKVAFEVDGVTTATTRTMTVPNRNITLGGITLGTSQVSTSGTSIDFTGIPSGVKRITISLVGVSTNGTTGYYLQLGDSGGIEVSGYLSATGIVTGSPSTANFTAGFEIAASASAATVLHGSIVLTLVNASTFTWACMGVMAHSNTGQIEVVAGSKSTSAELDRVRITSVGGADTFDAGEINICYE